MSSLLRRPGSQLSVSRDLAVDAAVVDTRCDPERPVSVELVIESAQQGVVVTGTVAVPWTGACRRCLEPVSGSAESKVREMFGGPDPDEGYPLVDEEVDLEPLVRDVASLSLPLAPLCDEGCQGPDPEHHPTTVAGRDQSGEAQSGDAPSGDPRWAALDGLRFDGPDEPGAGREPTG